jgi:flagellar basal body-associated protein FliL
VEKDKKSMNRLLRNDSVLLIVFGVVAIVTVCYILVQVLGILEDPALGSILVIVAIISILTLVGAMAGVFVHLHKNKTEVYGEELYYQELIKKEKEGIQL